MDARMVSLHGYRQDEYAQRLASDAKTNEWGRCSCENDPEGCREKRHRWIAFYDENAPGTQESAAFRGSCNNSHKVLRSQKVRIIPGISVKIIPEVFYMVHSIQIGHSTYEVIGYFAGISPWRM